MAAGPARQARRGLPDTTWASVAEPASLLASALTGLRVSPTTGGGMQDASDVGCLRITTLAGIREASGRPTRVPGGVAITDSCG